MSKHKAVFYGEKRRLVYNVWGLKELHPYYKFVEHVPILEIELDNPPIAEQEKVNIDSTDRPVIIMERVRNLDGSYNYYTNRIVETIKDEITKQSKLDAEIKIKKWYFFWR